jgi:hypothetical protein
VHELGDLTLSEVEERGKKKKRREEKEGRSGYSCPDRKMGLSHN